MEKILHYIPSRSYGCSIPRASWSTTTPSWHLGGSEASLGKCWTPRGSRSIRHMILVKNTLTKISFLWKQFRSDEVFHPLAKISTYDHHEFISTFRPQNLKNAEGYQVAAKPKRLPSELPHEVMPTIAEMIGRQSKAVTRIVQEGQCGYTTRKHTQVGLHLNNNFLLFICFRSCELQVEKVASINEKVLILEGNPNHSCIIRMPNFCGVCG